MEREEWFLRWYGYECRFVVGFYINIYCINLESGMFYFCIFIFVRCCIKEESYFFFVLLFIVVDL